MASAPPLGHKALTAFIPAFSCAPAALPSAKHHAGFFKARDVHFRKVNAFLCQFWPRALFEVIVLSRI